MNLLSETGYQVFALQAGGWCASSPTALDTYKKYGQSSNCASDGEGGGWANQVYLIKFDGEEHFCEIF